MPDGSIFADLGAQGNQDGTEERFGRQRLVEGAGKTFRKGWHCVRVHGGEGIGPAGENGPTQSAQIVAVVGEVPGQPFQQFRVAGGVGRVHLVYRVHNPPSHQDGPEAVDEGAGEGGVVLDGNTGQFPAAGELGKGGLVHGGGDLRLFPLFLGFWWSDPVRRGSNSIILHGVFVAASAWFLHHVAGEEYQLALAALTFQVGELVVSAGGMLSQPRAGLGGHVAGPIEEGDQTPVVLLFDFGSDRMIVTLGTLQLLSKEGG